MENVCKFTSVRSGEINCSTLIFETTSVQSDKARAEGHIIGLVAKGRGVLSSKAEKNLSAGNIFIIKNSTPFSVSGEELEYFYINFQGRRADELIERAEIDTETLVYTPESSELLINFAFDCLNRATDENVDLVAQSMLLLLFSCLCKAEKESGSLIQEIISLTHDNFTSVNFSLAALAQDLGYDAKYLSAYFKKNKGVCYTDYLRDLRIRHSIFLIEQGISGIKSIAWLSGFSDSLYFSKVFKSVTGLSPKAYIDKFTVS